LKPITSLPVIVIATVLGTSLRAVKRSALITVPLEP